MALSYDLISQFAKLTSNSKRGSSESTVYGTVVADANGNKYVKLDGSDQLTPLSDDERPTADSTSVDANVGERVSVLIKNHTATVTGNISSPAARTDDVKDLGDQVTEIQKFDILIGQRVEANEGYIKNLQVDKANVGDLNAATAKIQDLEAKKASVEELNAAKAEITDLVADKIDAEVADLKFATIENLDATNAEVDKLQAKDAEIEKLVAGKASIDDLDATNATIENLGTKYANIDFANIGEAAIRKIFADSGLIKDLVVGDSTITGELVGVTIKGDLIEGNTVKADKLVVKGSDGLYYKLNIEAGAVASAEVSKEELENGLHGTAIIAKTITAEKISVKDLVAFGATIGGFKITDSSLYSGVKESVDNTTRGVYLDSDGQVAFGDNSNFLKYFKDQNGVYRLEISAGSILFGASQKSVEDAIDEVQDDLDNLEIGGRNLIQKNNIVGQQCEIALTSTNDISVVSVQSANTSVMDFGVVLPAGTYTLNLTGSASGKMCRLLMSNQIGGACEYNDYYESLGFPYFMNVELPYTFSIETEISLGMILLTGDGNQLITGLKLERGDKATDWTPAPEDIDEALSGVSEEASEASNTANDASTRLVEAESYIQQLAESIAMLITDENGASLMTQTEDGWTFNMGQVSGTLDEAVNDIDSLTESMGGVDNTVQELTKAVHDLGVLTDYVIITTYNDQPCIELGEVENNFKLRITNTQIQFVDGSAIPAYLSNQKLYIEKGEITDELQLGNFVWKIRSNGNMGLMWKEVSE